MRELSIALRNFWHNRFTAKALTPPFARSPVPARPLIEVDMVNPPSFPLITFDIMKPGLFAQVIAVVFVYDRHVGPQGQPGQPGFTARIYDIQEQIEQVIPPIGSYDLQVGESGKLRMFRGTPWFPPSRNDPNDRLVTQAFCNIILRDLTN